MFVLLVVQADTGALSGYRRDATVRSVGIGWRETAAAIEARGANGSHIVLASIRHHRWLAFHLPKGPACAAEQRIAGSTCPSPIQRS